MDDKAVNISHLFVAPAGLFWRDVVLGVRRVYGFIGDEKYAMQYRVEPLPPLSKLKSQDHE